MQKINSSHSITLISFTKSLRLLQPLSKFLLCQCSGGNCIFVFYLAWRLEVILRFVYYVVLSEVEYTTTGGTQSTYPGTSLFAKIILCLYSVVCMSVLVHVGLGHKTSRAFICYIFVFVLGFSARYPKSLNLCHCLV